MVYLVPLGNKVEARKTRLKHVNHHLTQESSSVPDAPKTPKWDLRVVQTNIIFLHKSTHVKEKWLS